MKGVHPAEGPERQEDVRGEEGEEGAGREWWDEEAEGEEEDDKEGDDNDDDEEEAGTGVESEEGNDHPDDHEYDVEYLDYFDTHFVAVACGDKFSVAVTANGGSSSQWWWWW